MEKTPVQPTKSPCPESDTNRNTMLPRSQPHLDTPWLVRLLADEESDDRGSVERFERSFASYFTAQKAVATSQGRSGLLIALQSICLRKGDEVIVPSFTFHGVVAALLDAQVTPVLADSMTADCNMHSDNIRDLITAKTKAIVATHLFGIPCDISEIAKLAAENDCILIEDCAQCLGARLGSRLIGTFGDIAIFSFNIEKHMTTGHGGMILVNRSGLSEALQQTIDKHRRTPIETEKRILFGLLLQHYLMQRDMYTTTLDAACGITWCTGEASILNRIEAFVSGRVDESSFKDTVKSSMEPSIGPHDPYPARSYVSKGLQGLYSLKNAVTRTYEHVAATPALMNSLRARYGMKMLDTIDHENRRRNENAQLFFDLMADHRLDEMYSLPAFSRQVHPAFLKANVLKNTPYDSSRLIARARIAGYELGNFQWPAPVHRNPQFRFLLRYRRSALNNCETIARSIINVPLHPEVRPDDYHAIVTLLRSFST
jgi:perosamine synthetase